MLLSRYLNSLQGRRFQISVKLQLLAKVLEDKELYLFYFIREVNKQNCNTEQLMF